MDSDNNFVETFDKEAKNQRKRKSVTSKLCQSISQVHNYLYRAAFSFVLMYNYNIRLIGKYL